VSFVRMLAKYSRAFLVVLKHFLWYSFVRPKLAGQWMLLMQVEDDWLTYQNSRIPFAKPEELVPDIDEQRIMLSHCFSADTSSLFPRELLFLAALIRHLEPHTLFEFGTSLGRTTLNLALNSPADARIYTLDLPLDFAILSTRHELLRNEKHIALSDRSFVAFDGTPEASRIKRIFRDSAKFKTDDLRRGVDFVFIDGSHSFEYVKNDSEKAFEMLASNGTIVWHDFTNGYQWPGVKRYLLSLADDYDLRRVWATNLVVFRQGPSG